MHAAPTDAAARRAQGAEPRMSALLPTVLHLADNALVLGQRNAEWCGHGPLLEEDIAMANISLDLIGQARLLYALAARLQGGDGPQASAPKTEDDYAFWRSEAEFRNLTLCELPHCAALSGNARTDRDYAVTIVRNFLYSAWMLQVWGQLQQGDGDAQPLADIAGKSVKETRYHLRHARDWLVRMGDGTAESHARAQAALDHLMPYTQEFWAQPGLAGEAARAAWSAAVDEALAEATLVRPADAPQMAATGSQGRHSEHMGYLLA
ncbi:MAG: phenylacetate-CoA oxygenase subunit PaaC, partial [Betaproteobacteria bacterium]|nr:phenylacetate-CoA oxygenase subunit PaaC [Betaproteobacteria bacterium]